MCFLFQIIYIYTFFFLYISLFFAIKEPISFLFASNFHRTDFISLATQVAEKRALLNFNVADTEELQKALFETLHTWWIIPLSKQLVTTIHKP